MQFGMYLLFLTCPLPSVQGVNYVKYLDVSLVKETSWSCWELCSWNKESWALVESFALCYRWQPLKHPAAERFASRDTKLQRVFALCMWWCTTMAEAPSLWYFGSFKISLAFLASSCGNLGQKCMLGMPLEHFLRPLAPLSQVSRFGV